MTVPPANSVDDEESSLLDLLIALVKHKKLILGLPFVVAVIAAGYSLTLTETYTADTMILPPQQSQSAASALLSQIGGVAAGLVGGAAGIKGPSDIYLTMLKSRTLADGLIERFELMKRYGVDVNHHSDAYKTLAGSSRIFFKEGVITIEVTDADPKFAADLANAYVEELLKLTSVIGVTEASQRRLFFERQFAKAKDNLTKAEAATRQALDKGGLVKVEDQGRSMVENTARLRAQISAKEVQIGSMRTYAAERNPDLKMAEEERESMMRQLAKFEGAGKTVEAGSASAGKGIDNLSLLRDLKYNEVLYEMLAKQYELAKIDEAKDTSTIQVVDKALAPDRRSGPKRTQLVLLWALAALFAGILWALAREALARSASDPRQAVRLEAIKRNLSWR